MSEITAYAIEHPSHRRERARMLRDGDRDDQPARERARGDRHFDADSLTRQQRRIVRGLLRGRASQQVACDLRLSVRTVYWHIENTYRRTGSHSVGEFFAWAYRHRECCRYVELFEERRP